MAHFTSTTYNEASNGDLPTDDLTVLDFGVNTQITGRTDLSDVDQARFDVHQSGATDFNPGAPAPGSLLQISLSAANVSYFDFYIYDQNLNVLFHQIKNDTTTTSNFVVNTNLTVPNTDYLIFSMNGFLFDSSFNFNSVGYSLTVNGTPVSTPTVVTLTGPGVLPEGNVGDHNKMIFTLTRSGDLQHADDIDWTLTPVSGKGANPLDFAAGVATLPLSNTVHFNAGETVKTIEFTILGDNQPELQDAFRLSITAQNSSTQVPTTSVDATILNDDGARNVDSLIYWALNKDRTANTNENDLPGFAHSALNGERNYDADDFNLLLASRYTYGLEFGVKEPLKGGAIAVAQFPYDLIKFYAKTLTVITKIEFEKLIQTGDQPPSWPNITEAGAFEVGWWQGVTGAWKNAYLPPAAFQAMGETTAQFAAAAPAQVIYVRSTDSSTQITTINGVAYTVISGPNIPATNDATFVFDTINDLLLQTGSGDDQIISARERAQIDAGDGDDLIFVRDSGSTIDAGLGHDMVVGGDGVDNVTAGSGADTVFGGDGGDFISGGEQGDTLFGEAGNDSIGGGMGLDSIDGGLGDDTILGGLGNDAINGGSGFDRIDGGDGDDTINGNDQGDVIAGGTGNDSIGGGMGLDTINGGIGSDTIVGARGNDSLTGGIGTDIFVFNAPGAANDGLDTITDFLPGSDILQISAAGFGGGLIPSGSVTVLNVANLSAVTTGGAHFIFRTTDSSLWWDQTGGISADAVEIAILTGVAALQSSDFHVV